MLRPVSAVKSIRLSWLRVSAIGGVLCLSCSVGCERSEQRAPGPVDLLLPGPEELIDALPTPGETPSSGPARCTPVLQPGPQILTRSAPRGTQELGPTALEFSNAAAFSEGFALGTLHLGERAEAEVALLFDRGGMQAIRLGRVHGPVDPPVVAARGDVILAAISDSDAGDMTVRLAKVAPAGGQVTWGPELGQGRGESAGVSLALASSRSAVLAVDRFERQRARSAVMVLPFDPASMKETGPTRVVSLPDEDAERPRLVPAGDGYWLLYVAFPEQKSAAHAGQADAHGLVAEPPHVLRAARLDARGSQVAEPLTISGAPSESLVFDAVSLPQGKLLVAYREVPTGRPADGHPVHLAEVALDGSVAFGLAQADDEELGPGAPVLLVAQEGPQLMIEGTGSSVLLADVTSLHPILTLEPGLFGRIPLAAWHGCLLAARPRGLDIELERLRCARRQAAETKPPAAP